MDVIKVKWNKSALIYRSYLVHPKYRIIYRQMKTTIRFVEIICNQMEHKTK